jgi:hypothetical protein
MTFKKVDYPDECLFVYALSVSHDSEYMRERQYMRDGKIWDVDSESREAPKRTVECTKPYPGKEYRLTPPFVFDAFHPFLVALTSERVRLGVRRTRFRRAFLSMTNIWRSPCIMAIHTVHSTSWT